MARKEQNSTVVFDVQTMLMEEIGKFRLLSSQEERALLICKNDDAVREKLICHNLRLVCSIVKRYQSVSDFAFCDLFQLGTEGLIHAIDLYDLAYETRLSTFATKVIKRYVERSLAQYSEIHISDGIRHNLWNVTWCEIYLTQQLGCMPTPSQIADELNITLEELEKRREIQKLIRPLSLSLPCSENAELGDNIEDIFDMDQNLIVEKLRQDIRTALDRLNPRERHILILHYGIGSEEPISQEKIAEQLGISKQRIQQIEKSAIKKLRTSLVGYESE